MKIRIGQTYKVSDCSGLDSGRVGRVVDPHGHSIKFFYEIEPGRYRNFDHKQECLLVDSNGKYFTMFKNRLVIEKA